MSAVVVTAIFTPVSGKRDELVAALTEVIPAVHEEPGCELYAIHDAPDDTIVMLEKWSSREQLDAHSSGPAVARLLELINGLVANPPKVTVMNPISAGTAEQGAV